MQVKLSLSSCRLLHLTGCHSGFVEDSVLHSWLQISTNFPTVNLQWLCLSVASLISAVPSQSLHVSILMPPWPQIGSAQLIFAPLCCWLFFTPLSLQLRFFKETPVWLYRYCKVPFQVGNIWKWHYQHLYVIKVVGVFVSFKCQRRKRTKAAVLF